MLQASKYYNYILLDPRKPLEWEYNGIRFHYAPFYVGKGCGNRCINHYKYLDGTNPHKESTIRLLKRGGFLPNYTKLYENSSELDALSREIEIISYIRNTLGITLTNIAEGGNLPPHYFGAKNHKAVRVYQYDKDTGEFLNEFECIREACRKLGFPEEASSHIVSCCRGTRRTYGSFKWSYEKSDKISPNSGKYDRIKFSKLIGYNATEIHEFKSMKEAYDFLGEKNKGKINLVLKGERSTYKGYYWKLEG